jgi:Trypsin-like peptidase domain
VDGVVRGIGFAIGPTLALTARHVIKDTLDDLDRQLPERNIDFITSDGNKYCATVGPCNRRLDVASLNLGMEVANWLGPTEPAEGESWRVDSRPRDDDPMLSGSITSCARPLVTEDGEEALLLQLHVQQSLGDYSGYSGSPVRFGSKTDDHNLVGILIEQARWRRKEPTQQLAPVANVLYAVPIDAALVLLGIKAQTVPDLGLEVFRKRMEKLKAIESEVDQELIREARKEVIDRYVYGER